MQIAKRIVLFLFTNIAIILLIGIVVFVLERYFGIKISPDMKSGVVPLLIFSAIYGFSGAFISLAISRWIAKKLYSIEVIKESEILNYPSKVQYLFFKTKEFANRKGITVPEFGIYESADPNAFATGPSKNKSLIAVSTGLLDLMDQAELEGVLAHEMAHVTNGDMVTMTLLQGVINTFVIFLARAIAYFIDMVVSKDGEKMSGIAYFVIVFVLEIILSIFASILVMAYSRKREYSADRDSGFFTPKQNMIKALKKLKQISGADIPSQQSEMAAFQISGKKSLLSIFSSHPELDDRIAKLEATF